MNEDVKTEWVKRLRSGDYPQTKEHLRDDNGYCCLGVLCEVAREANVVTYERIEGGTAVFHRYDGETGALPTSVRLWAGVSGSNPLTDVYEEEDGTGSRLTLAELNDNLGMSFAEIADVIERDL